MQRNQVYAAIITLPPLFMLAFDITDREVLPYLILLMGMAMLYSLFFSGIGTASMVTSMLSIFSFFVLGYSIIPFFLIFLFSSYIFIFSMNFLLTLGR